jgi:pyrimidine-specific ribonucleoside hydrolase
MLTSNNLFKKLFLLCILSMFSLSSFAKRPMIIDTDIGVDDVIAIIYLLKHPDIEVKAITIACDGNAHCNPGVENTLGLLQLMQQPNITVAPGLTYPLKGHHHFPEKVLVESDTLNNTAKILPHNPTKPYPSAVSLLHTVLTNSKTPIDILAIGPLTNIAELIKKHPEIKEKIGRIYIMGGAIHTKGNLIEVDSSIKNQKAEWNLYLDPYAADVVFKSGIAITLTPLDLTNQFPIDKTFYLALKKSHNTKAADLVYQIFHNNQEGLSNWWYFWDPLAAFIAGEKSNCSTEYVKIALTPENNSGATIIDKKQGNPVQVCYQMNKKYFERELFNKLQS